VQSSKFRSLHNQLIAGNPLKGGNMLSVTFSQSNKLEFKGFIVANFKTRSDVYPSRFGSLHEHIGGKWPQQWHNKGVS
jgi:hypothetical protein